ncbi:hypothetical protein LINPERPRIM_LOCUS7979, partial [Linum perenne]
MKTTKSFSILLFMVFFAGNELLYVRAVANAKPPRLCPIEGLRWGYQSSDICTKKCVQKFGAKAIGRCDDM